MEPARLTSTGDDTVPSNNYYRLYRGNTEQTKPLLEPSIRFVDVCWFAILNLFFNGTRKDGMDVSLKTLEWQSMEMLRQQY